MSPPIELIVFDMDDVLARLDRPRRLLSFAKLTGRSTEELHAAIWGSDFESAAEAGALATGDDYLAELNRRIGASLTREQWIEARRDAMTPIAGTLELAARLRDRHRVAMLTNNGPLLREAMPILLPQALAIFGEQAFASCQLKARKPDAEVFRRLLERCGVAAERAVFIDDTPSFVEGARRVGMHGVLFTEPDRLADDLRRLGLDWTPTAPDSGTAREG